MISFLIEFILGLFFSKKKYFTGLLEDQRSEEEKQKDYIHEERVLAAITNPFGNKQLTVSPYPIENQYQTSSCVSHGVGLALAIERKNDTGQYVRVSYIFPYRLRSNFPQEGSIPVNIFSLYAKYGAPLYSTLPTPTYEKEANELVLTSQMYLEGEIFKGKEFYTLKIPNDIRTIAEIAQKGHGVAITIYATKEEWGREWPYIINPKLDRSVAEIRHEVCVLPYSGFIKNGKKYVTIQDSAWFGGVSLRHVPEDFIKARCYGAGYWDTVSTLGVGTKPKYVFTKVLSYGSTGPEVKAMQQLLIAEGLLPTDCATGNFYGRTLAGVKAFQNKYAEEILKPLQLNAPTSTWGSMCIAMANKLCK